MATDIRRELNKIDDGSAKTVGRKIGKQLEDSVADGAKGGANQIRGTLSERLGNQVGSVVGRGVGAGLHGAVAVASKAGALALTTAMTGAAGVAALAVGGVGLALTKGFDRLRSIDEAKAKLGALGNDAASISKIMDSALASVKGTAFGMDDAVTAAASATAAGIKPGQDLTKYLTEVGDAAAIAGTSFSDMGSIFNKIQTSNKAYTDDLQQLSDRGLPIFQWLQKEYGVTGEALSKMVQNGEVDAAHFQAAIADNIGGAAQKMGQSFEGSVQNAEAALGRLGAAFLAPIFGNAAGGIGSITDGLDRMTAWVNAHQVEIIKFFTDMGVAAVSVAQDILKSFGNIMQGVGQFSSGLGSILDGLGIDNNLSSIGTTITNIGDSLVTTANGFDSAKQKIRDWGAATSEAANNARTATGAVAGLGTQVGALPFKKTIAITADTSDAQTKLGGIGKAVGDLPFKKTINIEIHGTATGAAKDSFDGVTVLPGGLLDPGPANPTNPIRMVPRRAGGGPVFGAGSATSDSIPALLSNGEYVVKADAAQKNLALLEVINSGKLPGFAGGGNTGGSLTPNAQQLKQLIGQAFPEITDIGGWRPPDGFNEHSSGQALDLMIPNPSTPEGKALGDRLNQWLLQNADSLGIQYDLWQQQQWNPDGSTSAMSDRGGVTANHRDHVHVRVKPGEATGASLTDAFADSMSVGAKDQADKLAESSKNGGSGSGAFDASSLGQSLFGGLLQGMGLDGSVFSNPFEWPNVKSLMAGLNFGGSLLQGVMGGDQSGAPGGGGGMIPGLNGLSSFLTPNGPQATRPVDPLTPTHGMGGGAALGPAVVVNGNVGMDPRGFTQRVESAQNQAWRKSGMNAVKP